jgi:Tfp pilus assembly protein PilV
MKPTTRHQKPRTPAGYSFAEVLVASALLGLAIGGAVSLTATMTTQTAAAFTSAAAQNYQDNASRVWQLGLSPAETLAVMPHVTDNADLQSAIVPAGTAPGSQVSFGTAATTTLANSMGTLESIPCTLTLRNPIGAANRALTLQVYRPTIR